MPFTQPARLLIGTVFCGVISSLSMPLAGVEALAPVLHDQVQQADSIRRDSQEALLRGRVQARWQALIEHKFDVAYQFETPAYRAIYSPRQYQLRYGGQVDWRVANVKDIHYDDPDVAKVMVEVSYGYVDPVRNNEVSTMSNHVKETWLYKEGQWWFHGS